MKDGGKYFSSFKNVIHPLIYDPAVLLPSVHSKELPTKILVHKKNLCMDDYSTIILNSPSMETSKCPSIGELINQL